MKAAALSIIALTCSCANAFTVSTASLRAQPRGRTSSAASSTSLQMGWSLKEADFIPSEEWLGDYLGDKGLRYRMDKTEKEIEEEGDYTLLEKLFGQTSNNQERMKLKQAVLDKANIPTDPERYKTWTEKYGYGRFFPVYVDKSGSADDSPAPAAKAAAPKAAAAKKPGFSFSNPFSGASAPAKKVAAKAAPKVAAKPKAAPKVAAKAVKAAPKVVAKKAAPKPVVKKAAPKPMGNINNLPKAL